MRCGPYTNISDAIAATRREPWRRKLVAAVCAVALALLSVPLGVFHAPQIAEAAGGIPTLAAGDTWNQSATAKSTVTTINIVDTYLITGDESEAWDASAAQDGSVMAFISADGKTLTIAGNGSGKIMANENSQALFGSTEWSKRWVNLATINGISLLDVSNTTNLSYLFAYSQHMNNPTGLGTWNTHSVTDMSYAFAYWLSSTFPDIASWDTSSVTTMRCMFDVNGISAFDIDEWDVSKVEDMYAMFRGGEMTSIDLSSWSTSSLKDIGALLALCSNLTTVNVSNLETGLITNMDEVFNGCTSLTSIIGLESWDTSSATSMCAMFVNCSVLPSINVSSFDTNKVTDMSKMFMQCKALTNLQGVETFITSQVTNMDNMFARCYALTSLDIDHFDTSKVETMNSMFDSDSALQNVDVSQWDVSSLVHARRMFENCSSLSVIDVSRWDIQRLSTAQYMFNGCKSVTTLDVSGWKLGNMTDSTSTPYMFANCDNLTSLTIPASLSIIQKRFAAFCPSLTTITFLHRASDALTFTEAAGSDAGAFYVADTLATTVVTSLQAVKDYAWATDNRTVTFEDPPIPTLAKMDTWYTQGGTTIEKSTFTTINIVDEYASTGSELDYWDASAALDGSVMAYVSADGTTLTIAGNGYGKIYANQYSQNAFKDFTTVTAINGANLLDTSNATNLSYMFRSDEKLVTLDVSNWNTSSCTDMSDMFYWCKALAQLDVSGWQTGNVVYMDDLFGACETLTELNVGSWDVSSCKNMNYLFAYCDSLENFDVSNWDVSNVTTMDHMFSGTSSTAINMDAWDTSSCKNYEFMFWNCGKLQELNVNHFSFEAGTTYSLEATFACCSSLTTLNLSNWTSPKIVNLDNTFQGCTNLASLTVNGWDTSNVTDFTCCFYKCENLEVLDLSGWGTQSATSATKMFDECVRLRQVTLDGDFSFNGSTATRLCNLPTPDPAYIPGANGKWQAVGTGTVIAPAGTIYDPADVPNNVAETYVMPLVGVDIDVPIRVTLALDANGDFCTPTAADNKIINHTAVGAKVVSAVAAAQSGFQLVQAGDVGSSTQANAFGGTITAGSGAASDLSSISTTGSNWTMAAGSVTDGSNQIALQLTGGIRNTGSGLLAAATHVFGITYTFDLDI